MNLWFVQYVGQRGNLFICCMGSRSDLSNSFVNVMSSPVLIVLVIEVHKDLNLQTKGVLVVFPLLFYDSNDFIVGVQEYLNFQLFTALFLTQTQLKHLRYL